MSDKVKLLVSLSVVGVGLVAVGIFVIKKILDSDDCCAPEGCVYNCDDCPFDRESDDCYDDKALADDTLIPVDDDREYLNMGDLRPGDYVLDEYGIPTEVLKVFK